MKETEEDDFIPIQLPPTLFKLTINDVDARLSFYDEVHYSMLEHIDCYSACKNIVFSPDTDLSNLYHFSFGITDVGIILLDYILDLISNLKTLTLWDSSLNDENLDSMSKFSELNRVIINSSDLHFSIDGLRYTSKSIQDLSVNYEYDINMWPSTPLVYYGFTNLTRLTLQYFPAPNSISVLIRGLYSLKYLKLIGKPYNLDIDNLDFLNLNIEELKLTYFQYSQLNFKIFKKWLALKKITIDLSTPMTNYYIYFELCEMLKNWKYYTYPNSVQFYNMNKN